MWGVKITCAEDAWLWLCKKGVQPGIPHEERNKRSEQVWTRSMWYRHRDIMRCPCDVHLRHGVNDIHEMSGGLRRSFLRDSPREQSMSTNLRELCEQCGAQVSLPWERGSWLSAKIQVGTRQTCQTSYAMYASNCPPATVRNHHAMWHVILELSISTTTTSLRIKFG